MYRKDFILRMIEMISELIAGILELIRKGEYSKASQSIDTAYVDYLKQDAAFFHSLKKEELIDTLLKKHNYTNGQLEMLAELYFAEAELAYAKGEFSVSIDFYEKSLILQDFVEKESKSYSIEKQSRISILQDRIARLKNDLPN